MPSHTYRIWIAAEPAAVWRALTDPAVIGTYAYGGDAHVDLVPGGAYRVGATPEMRTFGAAEVMVEGEVLAVEPEARLVQTWRAVWDEQIAAEPAGTLTYVLERLKHGVTKLTLTHELEDAPITEAITRGDVPEAGGGWAFVLSDLKTLLETGTPLPPQMG